MKMLLLLLISLYGMLLAFYSPEYEVSDHKTNNLTTLITKQDTIPPTLVSCPAGGDLGCNPDPSAYAPTAAEWQDEDTIVEQGVRAGTPIPVPKDESCKWMVNHQYYAIDEAGNESTCEQTFIWTEDTDGPRVYEYEYFYHACYKDCYYPNKCEVTIPHWTDCRIVKEGIRSSSIIKGCTLITIYEFYAIDQCGKESTFIVDIEEDLRIDTEEPIFETWPGSDPIFLGCDSVMLPSVEEVVALVGVSDDCGVENLNIDVRVSDIARNCINTRSFLITATDKCGNSNVCLVEYEWVPEEDTTPPTVVSCPTGGNLGCNPNPSAYAPSRSTWSDDCKVETIGVRAGTPTFDGCNWTVTHEYYAIDKCGNEGTCTQTFTWQADTLALTCTFTGIIPALTCGVDSLPDLRGFLSLSDACAATNQMTVEQNPAPGTPITGDVIVTFTVKDVCNNIGTCTINLSCTPLGEGCTYSSGYWKNHEEDICVDNIPCLGDPLTALNGHGSNAWVILARAYAAAYLNNACAGASLQSIQSEFDQARYLLCTYNRTYASTLRGNNRAKWTKLADQLDRFNNGLVGPPACENGVFPSRTVLLENFQASTFPNPFREETTIRFTLPYDTYVTVEIYNAAGQRITTLFSGQVNAHITQDVIFEPQQPTNALYFYRINTARGAALGKIMRSH